MEKSVNKAVILCAGRGTRLLPATRAIPKEMFPIYDRPALEFLLDELVLSGIQEVLIVINLDKEIIKKYYTQDSKLYEAVKHDAQLCAQACVRQDIKIEFVYQNEPLGTSHAVKMAQEFVCHAPFALLMGDDLIVKGCATAQLVQAFEACHKNVLGVQEVQKEKLCNYGVLKYSGVGKILNVEGIVEKPQGVAPSSLAILGRYVLCEDIFEAIEQTYAEQGEQKLTDALHYLAQRQRVCATIFAGVRYDLGSKEGYFNAFCDYKNF